MRNAFFAVVMTLAGFGLASGGTAKSRDTTPGPSADGPPKTPLRIWYQSPAPDSNDGWLTHSLPLGNGYMGVNAFGGVQRERLQITENSVVDTPDKGGAKASIGGLNSFAEVYLDFPHAAPTNYVRDLSFNDATAHVTYDNAGVRYTREYFTSYPDKVMVIRLTASKPGALDFTLRPQIPYLAAYRTKPGDNRGKRGTVTAKGDIVTLAGQMDYYGLKFEGQFKVIADGGETTAANDGGAGTISVRKANSATIIVAVGTNYPIGNPQVFSAGKPLDKLKGFADPHRKVSDILASASRRRLDDLRARHLADYRRLYDRVDFSIGAPAPSMPTDAMVAAVRAGTSNPYLDELAFQYGRYLLISSSRKGALPPNLQGVWNVYQDAPWTAGYWHNVNEQMNYWPAFNTDLVELFDSYVDMYRAYLPAHQALAGVYLKQYHPAGLAADGDNGWAFGNSTRPFEPSSKVGHSGFGTGAWTTMLFWDAYDFTRDTRLLRATTYPAMRGQANFLSRFIQDIDGKLLAKPSSSPENAANLQTAGTTFDQEMIYENFRDTISASRTLGLKDRLIPTLTAQLPRLDPILIGDSGQIKEYREETTYGSIGDPVHRHVSQLLGLFPGQLINATTPAWLDGARITLNGRGTTKKKGWSQAELLATWARTGDGERAYDFYRYWQAHHAMANLWNNHNDSPTSKLFQIDANFGVTAGVGEMLLQSHDGTVTPLAALPRAWPTGSYRGLLARGAFSVSADWANGQATRFVVVSRAGGPLRLRYPGVAGATIRTADGGRVALKAEGNDVVAIDTVAGRTYVVTAIPRVEQVAAVEKLAIAADARDAVRLDWQAAPGVTYAVDRAIGDVPTYDRIATGLTVPSFTDTSAPVGSSRHVRYRVTAVGSSGRESRGTAIFRLLPAAADARALRIDDSLIGYDADGGSLPETTTSDGKYAVAMDWAGGNLTEVRLTAKAAGTASVRAPMFDRPVRVEAGGRAVAAQPAGGVLTLPMQAGQRYRIVSQAVVTTALPAGGVLANRGIPVVVTVKADRARLAAASVALTLPEGWRAEPADAAIAAVAPGRTRSARFVVSAPATVADGRYPLTATVTSPAWSASTPLAIEVKIPNLALGKTATQSSVSTTGVPVSAVGGVAERAVDGNKDGQAEAGSITGTKTEAQPWWQVDLGGVKDIGTVILWNRTDSCCKAALADYYVLVSDKPIAGASLAQALKQPGVWSHHATTPPSPDTRVVVGRTGRFVRAWSNTTQELNLAEVQVIPSFSSR